MAAWGTRPQSETGSTPQTPDDDAGTTGAEKRCVGPGPDASPNPTASSPSPPRVISRGRTPVIPVGVPKSDIFIIHKNEGLDKDVYISCG